jgi:hypothetical protein
MPIVLNAIHALGLLLKNEPTRFASHPEADHRLPPLSLIGSSAVIAVIMERRQMAKPE